MASIQCAIELYDGVSPVLENMAVSLDGLIGKFEAFDTAGGLMGSLIDNESIVQATAAVTGLTAGLESAVAGITSVSEGFSQAAVGAGEMLGAVDAAQIGVQTIADSMSLIFSSSYVESFIVAVMAAGAGVAQFAESGQLAADGLSESFKLAGESIIVIFSDVSARVMSVFDSLGAYIRSFASSLPSYFSSPLASIASMFSALAASARSSMASIAASAGSAASSVRSAAASISSSVSGISTLSISGTASTYSVAGANETSGMSYSAAGHTDELFNISTGSEGIDLANIYKLKADEARGQTVINVEVNNENYISSETDVDAVLREFEDRLTEAVLSSAEGVY